MRTVLVRAGAHDDWTAAGDRLHTYNAGKKPLIAYIFRTGLKVRWEITRGQYGRTIAVGKTWTEGGALVAAQVAAHCPSRRGGRS